MTNLKIEIDITEEFRSLLANAKSEGVTMDISVTVKQVDDTYAVVIQATPALNLLVGPGKGSVN